MPRIRIQSLFYKAVPVNLPQNPIPDKISANEPYPLLWADLEGKPTTHDLGPWIKSNLYGCSGETPYVELRTAQAARCTQLDDPVQKKIRDLHGQLNQAVSRLK